MKTFITTLKDRHVQTHLSLPTAHLNPNTPPDWRSGWHVPRAQLTALYVADPYPYMGIGEVNPMGLQAHAAAAQQLAAQARR